VFRSWSLSVIWHFAGVAYVTTGGKQVTLSDYALMIGDHAI